MHKASRLSVPVVLSVLALGASAPFVAFATSANITQITFTTSPQTISANAVSAVLTTQTQNSEGTSEKISGGLQTINLHTTSGTGEFSASSTAWVSVTSLGMNSGTANRNFYYRDSTPGTYTLTITAQGKTWTAATQSITVSKANSTTVVTCPALEVYNGSAQAPCTVTVTGAGGLSLTPTPDYINNTDVGTANASYTYAGDTNYNGSSDNKDFSITKLVLTGSITADNKVYDRTTDATISGRSLTGVVEGDDVSASGGTATFGDKNIGTGKTVSATSITLTGTDIGNYSYDGNATGTADITAKDLVVSASGTGKVYDGNTGASAAVTLSTDAIEGDTVLAHGTAAFEDADVSTDKLVHVTNISIDGADAGNYHLTNTTADTTANITTNEGAVTINPADLTDITYNGTQHSVATTAQDQDSNPIDVTIDVTYDGSATAPTTAGSYAVHAAIDDANYAGSADATLVIAPAELTITPANQSKTYGDTFNFLGTEFTSGELASGDSITSVTLESAGATASAGVLGSPYDITGSDAIGTGLDNYDIHFNTGQLTVNKASLTVTSADKAKIEGTTFTDFTGTVEGLKNDDNITASYASDGAAADAAVGSYDITASLNDPDSRLGNYDEPTLHTGTLAVSAHVITASAGDHGSITPSGGVGVADGAGQSFTITPAEGYHVADVLVDDGSVGVVASYEFINVVGDHAIAASFARDTTKTITTGEENTATTSTDTGDVTVDIPSGAVVTGPIDWDGIITPPSATTTFAAPTPDSGFDSVTPVIALSVGAGDIPLTFDKAVKITFAGQAGKYVGWSRGGVFTQIPATCDDATNPTLASGSDCKIDVGSDLVVWTKHFTVFVTYTQTPTPAPAPAPASSSGSVGGAIIGGTGGPNPLPGATMVTATAPQAIGQVLGAAVFNFTTNLHLRSQGADVTALQQFLIDAGFSIPGGATGYFGGQTLAAVISYQKAHGITPASGYVGALTRAELNKGAAPTASESSHSSLTTDQANAIISLLQSFNAEANIVAKVKASLGLH